jgi:hypothetical protein
MAIPSDRIETPEIVWADLDETLEQVRERLQRPEIKNKWRAYVLVRSDDGRYAASSVFDIQPLVWEEGPPALKRTLSDLGLFQLHAGVEQDSIDLAEAQELAGRYGGTVVVLRGGHYAGLVKAPGRARYPFRPEGAFDLFDELLPRSTLAATPFVVATSYSTVAKVAADLASLPNATEAFIVVEMGDGSFRVVAPGDLDREVEESGVGVWATPLYRFESHLRAAEGREFATLGRKQAQALADQAGFLVITEGGKPVGLIVGQVVRREAPLEEARAYEAAKGADYSLFDAPRAFLDSFPPQVEAEKEPRFVNLWFEDAQKQFLDRSAALILGQSYHLALNVGRLLEQSIVAWGLVPAGPQAIVEPQEEANLYVSVLSQDFVIPEPTRRLWLPREGESATLHIPIEPLRRGWGTDPARLQVCLYYRAYLVQTFGLRVEVLGAGELARGSQPQVAELTHARTAGFPQMAQLPPQDLGLTISRDSADCYRFTFLVDPDPADEAAARRAVELSCLVRLTRDDLTHLITKARRQLHNVAQAFDLLQAEDVQTYRRATRALAQVGRQLYLKLFETGVGQTLAQWMEESLPDGSTIQIVDLAGDFVFPWSLIYTARPWADDEPVDITRFWGWRYRLAILTDRMLDTYCQAPTKIAGSDPLRFSVGVYERLQGIESQKGFFAGLNAQTGQRVEPEILNNWRTMSQALADADRDAYYFFCHGYTERMATDIQLDADLVGAFAQMAAEGWAARSESIREHLDDLFDVSDSWMRLTHGKIPLAMLKERVPARFSRNPLVFLNMCESAQVLPSLSDGFVPFFIDRGARAVLGTECSMNTVFADDFARNFLICFFEGKAAGAILLALRRTYLERGNPLALAYTLYGDADLRLADGILPGEAGSPCEEVFKLLHATERRGEMSQDETRREAVDVLWDDDMDGLMLTLAARVQAQEQGVAQDELQMWAPPEEAFALDVEAGPEWTAMMKALGERWWAKLEPRLYQLLCKAGKEHDDFMHALTEGAKTAAVALAPVLVAQVAALPAVAIVVATIVAKKAVDAGLEAACEMWKESLEKPEES